jgi:uncharacterized protein with PIN domain
MKCKDCQITLTNKTRAIGMPLEMMKKYPNLRVCSKCNEKYRDHKLDSLSRNLTQVVNTVIINEGITL